MKLTVNQLRGIIVALAVALMAFGASKALFKYDLGAEVEKWISQGLFFGAAICFLYLFQMRKKERLERERKAKEKGEGTGGGEEKNRLVR